MAAKAKLTDEQIVDAVRRHEAREPMSSIASGMGVDTSTISRAIKRYKGRGRELPPPATEDERAPRGEVGEVYDRTEIDGTVDVLRADRPASPDEVAEMVGIDRKKWVPTHYKPKLWQGFYKLKGFVPKDVVEELVRLRDGGADAEEIHRRLNRGALAGHRKVQLYGSSVSFRRVVTEELEHAILEFARENVGELPRRVRAEEPVDTAGAGQMVSWGVWDAHIGAYAWRDEVGEDWDVDIATRRVLNSVDDMIEELRPYPVRKVLMPVGNDFLHFDNARQRTTSGEHHLDVDSRFARVYTAGLRCLCYMVERAAEEFGDVEVIYVPGNHDLVLSYTLCAVLAHRYMRDERVRVDLGANPRKFRRHGGVLLGFDHGARSSPAQLAQTFSLQAKELWSGSTYREIQIGDKHQKWERTYADQVIPTNGVLIRRHPALCNVDFWHHEQSLIGEPMKSVEAWRYDEIGCRGSHVAWARDEEAASRVVPEMPR